MAELSGGGSLDPMGTDAEGSGVTAARRPFASSTGVRYDDELDLDEVECGKSDVELIGCRR